MEIIVDKDTFRVGEKAPVMLVVPTNDRYVLFTTEGEDLYSYKLVHMQGTVKLIELDIEEKHVPNIFLGAAFVSDRQMFVDSKQVIVPPTKNFISVDVKPDRPEYQPRDEGTFTITTLDHNKKPISAEVALSVVDESLFYIQQDYAGDPRQFYFGNKRPQYVQTQSTMNQKAYARLVRGPQDQVIDERDLARTDRGNRSENELYSYFSKDGDFEFRDGKKIEQLADRSEVGGFGGATRNRMQARGLAVNAPAPSLLAAASESKAKSGAFDALGAEPIEAAVQVRSDFRSTVLWQPTLTTDKVGKVVVKLKYPDSLTGWKATARVVSEGNQFGISDATTRTRQPLIVRLQAPRFFVVGDTLTISAVANNNTDKARDVKLDLEIAGGVEVSGRKTATVKVGGNLEGRADWVVHVTKPGEVKLKVTGRADALTDSMEKAYTAYEHGIEKFISRSGKMRHNEFTTSLVLPAERKPNSTSFSVQITPSLAVTMLDALPYLIDYPMDAPSRR